MDWLFNAEYPMLRWLEANGYDVSYTTGVDTARDAGTCIQNHKVFLSVGHDEYWSGAQRANVEAARDAGVNLAFFSGNEVFWKTRWEPSIDGSNTDYRTLVSYKETHANAPIDPPTRRRGRERGATRASARRPTAAGRRTRSPARSSRSTPTTATAITVPAADGKHAVLAQHEHRQPRAGRDARRSPRARSATSGTSTSTTASGPAGLVDLSSTTIDITNDLLLDNGSTYGQRTATHSLTLYRAPSGALVFGAGTVQWSWGLDDDHDRPGIADRRADAAGDGQPASPTWARSPRRCRPGSSLATKSTDTDASGLDHHEPGQRIE